MRKWDVWIALAILAIATLFALVIISPAKASIDGPDYWKVRNPNGCKIFEHEDAPWRHRPELHAQCNKSGGATGPAWIYYRFPGKLPVDISFLIEDRTHGQVGDGRYVDAWMVSPRVGVLYIPGPDETPIRAGTYVHVAKVFKDGRPNRVQE